MLNLAKVLGLGMTGAAIASAPVDSIIQMLAHRVYGPGYNSGAAPLTGDGTAKSYTLTTQNDSGAAIQKCSIVLQGWTLRSTGTTDCSANYDVSGTIEYPVGTVVGTIPATTVTPGGNVPSAEITLSSSIPTGGSFKVNLSATPANGATYITNLGFAGLRNHALKSTLKKACLVGYGDSIMTNNGGSLYNVALGKCGAYLNSIIGTTAQTYATGGNFTKQADLAQKLGATHVLTNFGTNDYGAGTTLAVLQGYITTLRDAVRAKGMKYVQMTMTPRVNRAAAVTASSVTSSGTTMSVAVPDASKFTAGQPVSIAGATQAEYNGKAMCIGVNTSTNIVSVLFAGSATSPATGTITIDQWQWSYDRDFMVPQAKYASGAGSDRGLFNAWVRGGAVDDYIDWGDACEPSRDDGYWLVNGQDALLPSPQLITVSSVTNTSRFNSNYSAGSNTIANGFVQALTGANAGVFRNGNGNTNGDITVSSAWPNAQQVGDQYWAVPGVSYMSDDGLHPRVAGGTKGGQPHLDNATSAWVTLVTT